MRQPSTILRFVRLFIAAIHLTVMGAAEIAEAQFLGENALVTHVESEEFDCPVQLHSDHCAICQFLLSAPDIGAEAGHLPFAVLERAAVADGYRPPHPRPLPSDQRLPRAPPSLLT